MILRIPIGAFLLNQDSVSAVEAMKEDRFFFRSTIEIYEGGIDAASVYLGDKKTPTLLIVETTAKKDKMFKQLEALANVCDPETRLILIGEENDILLFRTLIAEGVSDYLIHPVTEEALKDSVAKVFSDAESDADGRVIAFMGLTGGTGSSVISHNVAHELSTIYDEQVIVVDLDIAYGTAALNYNMQPRQTVVDALTQSHEIDPAMLNQFFMELDETDLSILASPASLSTGMQITTEPVEALMRVVKPMAEFIVIDLPHVWDGWVNDVVAAADEVVMVCRPDLTNLRNAKNVLEFLGPKRGVDAPTRLILNQVGAAKRSDLSSKDFKDALALEPALSIAYDPEAFGLALNNGEMMSKASKKSKATEGIINLAKIVSGREKADEKEKKGLGLFNIGKKKDKEKGKDKDKE